MPHLYIHRATPKYFEIYRAKIEHNNDENRREKCRQKDVDANVVPVNNANVLSAIHIESTMTVIIMAIFD